MVDTFNVCNDSGCIVFDGNGNRVVFDGNDDRVVFDGNGVFGGNGNHVFDGNGDCIVFDGNGDCIVFGGIVDGGIVFNGCKGFLFLGLAESFDGAP
jgi:hypothetical protein